MTAVNLKKILNDANKNNYAVAGLVVAIGAWVSIGRVGSV